MIRLHRLGHDPQPFHLNPDLILTVEAHPDTVVMLATGTRLLVCESPEEVEAAIRAWRVSILNSMTSRPRRSSSKAHLALVRSTTGEGALVAMEAIEATDAHDTPRKDRRS
jgi:flagellar protein FlbD